MTKTDGTTGLPSLNNGPNTTHMDRLIIELMGALDDLEQWDTDSEWIEISLSKEEITEILERLKA